MWSRFFTRLAFKRAALLPAILWLLPDWLREANNLREEDVEPDPLLLVLKKAKLAEMRKEYKVSEELYHEGLAMLHQQYQSGIVKESDFSLFQLHILNMMANSAYSRKDFTSAEILFKTCAQGFVSKLGYSTKDLAVIEVSLKLPIIYATLGRRVDAEAGYWYCIETMEANELVKDSMAKPKDLTDEAKNAMALYGMCLDGYARFLIDSSRHSEAVPVAQKAYDICKQVYQPDEPTSLLVSNLLGSALVESGQISSGQAIFQQCVATGKQALEAEVELRNEALNVGGDSLPIDNIKELELARTLCACQCNAANVLFRLNSVADNRNVASTDEEYERRVGEAKKLCYTARLLASRYRDSDCYKEVQDCLAKFLAKSK